MYLTTTCDFLDIGKYAYIGNGTLFRVFSKQTPANQVKKNAFIGNPVPTDDILPPIAKDQELRTMSIQILLTPREYQQLLSKLPTGQMSMALQSVA